MPDTPDTAARDGTVRVLARGLQILKAFAPRNAWLSNSEIAEIVGLPKPTVSRLTAALTSMGYLTYAYATGRYRLAPPVLALGYMARVNLGIPAIARPLMQALANAARGSVSLGLRDRTNMVYIETCRGHEALAFRPDIGGSMPIWSTSIGRAWLAGADPALRKATLQRIRAEHPGAWREQRSAVLAELEAFAGRGFCLGLGQWQQDIYAAGVPMRWPIDGETLVFNCGVPSVLLKAKAMEHEIGPRLVQMVRRIERDYLAEHGA